MKSSSNSMSSPVSLPNWSTQPRKNADALGVAVESLNQLLASDASGREREWANELDVALAHLQTALDQHRDADRAPDGALAAVDETRPTLARQADGLRDENDEFLTKTFVLREEVRQVTEGIEDFDSIRAKAEQLIAGLREHKDAETKLVLESINTDIGAGD